MSPWLKLCTYTVDRQVIISAAVDLFCFVILLLLIFLIFLFMGGGGNKALESCEWENKTENEKQTRFRSHDGYYQELIFSRPKTCKSYLHFYQDISQETWGARLTKFNHLTAMSNRDMLCRMSCGFFAKVFCPRTVQVRVQRTIWEYPKVCVNKNQLRKIIAAALFRYCAPDH